MNVIVTGHKGWIGTHVCQILTENQISFIGYDRKEQYRELNSICVQHDFQKDLDSADVVIHLAARPRIPNSWINTSKYIEDNIKVTEFVAKACASSGVHLVFASSSSVYGDGQGPLNPYSWTKLAGEELIKTYSKTLGLNYSICRLFTCYGEDAPAGADGLVIGRWMEAKKNGDPILVRGNGEQRRDFIHVHDVADALVEVAAQRPTNALIDIGTGVSYSLNEIAALFDCEIIREPELSGYAECTLADASKTETEINWVAHHNLIDWLNYLYR